MKPKITIEDLKSGRTDTHYAKAVGYGQRLMERLEKTKPDLKFYGRHSSFDDDHTSNEYYTIRTSLINNVPFFRFFISKKIAEVFISYRGDYDVRIFKSEFEDLIKNAVLELNQETSLNFTPRSKIGFGEFKKLA